MSIVSSDPVCRAPIAEIVSSGTPLSHMIRRDFLSLGEQKRNEASEPNSYDDRSNEEPYDDDEERAYELAI